MIRAFFKLNRRDRVVLVLAALAVIGLATALIFNFLSGAFSPISSFPDSVLLKDGKIQNYHYTTFRTLDKQIQFPGTDYGVSVGGDELNTTDYGVSFKYTDMITLIAAMADPSVKTADFVAEQFPAILSDGSSEGSGHYDIKKYDTGYLNSLEAEYEAGVLKTSTGTHYVLTYRLPYDGYSFVIGASVDKKSYLSEAFFQLTHMFYTFCRFGDSLEISTDDDSEDTKDVVVVDSQSQTGTAYTAPTIELMGEDRYETLTDAVAAKDRYAYELAYGDADYIVNKVDIPDSMSGETVVVAFEYTYGASTPSSAVLYSPDNTPHKADYYNTDMDGRIYFILDKPESGEWRMEVKDDVEMGVYDIHVLPYMAYMDAIGSGTRLEYDPDGMNREYLSITGTSGNNAR